MMKYKLLFSTFIMCTLQGLAQDVTKDVDIYILPQSEISIYGDAKIAEFTCNFEMDHLQEPPTITYKKDASKFTFQNAELVLRNRGFDCGKKSRNKDFHEMVKTEQFPEMKLKLREAVLKKDNSATATVDIFIAGKVNTYTIPVQISQNDGSRISGTFKINIRDFDLEPIKKMFGLIKVQDIIEINFDLRTRY